MQIIDLTDLIISPSIINEISENPLLTNSLIILLNYLFYTHFFQF